MMINKRLINLCSQSKKYIGLTILVNWLAIICNIITIFLVGQFINKVYMGGLTSINMESILKPGIIIVILLTIRFISNILYAKFSNLASAEARSTLRELVYKKLLRLGTGYSSVESTSSIVQVMVEGVEQLEILWKVFTSILLFFISTSYIICFYELCFI